LHDGRPTPMAHHSHALTRAQDFVVKSKPCRFASPMSRASTAMACHRDQVDEHLGRKKLEIRLRGADACRAYAQKYVDLKPRSLSALAASDAGRSHKTMSRDYEAKTLEAFYASRKGVRLPRLKPVYWCITTVALAEARWSTPSTPPLGVCALPTDVGREAISPLWPARGLHHHLDTTPWTCRVLAWPSSYFEYVAWRPATGRTRRSTSGAELAVSVARLQVDAPANWRGSRQRAGAHHYQHPFLTAAFWACCHVCDCRPGYRRSPHRARHGADDFYTGVRYNLDPTCRVDAVAHPRRPEAWNRATPPFEGLKVWPPIVIVAMLEESGALLRPRPEALLPDCWRCHHPVIFRATSSGSSPGDAGEAPDGSETTFRQLTMKNRQVVWDPAWARSGSPT